MATYSNLSYGSSGDEVKKLQQALINAGYDVGSTGADGKFGANTQAAVKKYQQDNGLSVDGIAGNNTLGKLYSTASTNTTTGTNTTQTQTQAPAVPDYSKYSYDSASDAAYQQALAALQQASQSTPTYAGTYDSQLNELYEQIVNRDKFKYDLNSDMLYQQYKDQYVNLGQMAMKDSMGQTAALTGGYGSSYGQSVGQQQYDAYLQQLNDVVPELYGMALDQYNAEGDDMLQQYGMLGDLADDEYGKYQDSLTEYWRNLDYLKGQADDAYDRGYSNWYNSYQMGVEAQESAYGKLVDMMANSGYVPSADELAAAGMSQAQADTYLKAWKAANPDLAYRTGAITAAEYYAYTGAYPAGYTPPSSGGGSSSGNNYYYTTYSNGDLTMAQVKELQEALGMQNADGKFGPNSRAAAGGLSAEEAYAKYVNGGNSGSYNLGELIDAAAGGMSKSQMETVLANRGVDTSKATVQADIKKALSK